MGRRTKRKRPWLAAVFGGLVVGGGHLYLRRWWRGIGWMVLVVAVAVVAVPESALQTMNAFEPPPIEQIAPTLGVALLSMADAYVLARKNNARLDAATTAEDGDSLTCPNCGRTTDADLAFCQWCSEPLPETEPPADRPDESRRR